MRPATRVPRNTTGGFVISRASSSTPVAWLTSRGRTTSGVAPRSPRDRSLDHRFCPVGVAEFGATLERGRERWLGRQRIDRTTGEIVALGRSKSLRGSLRCLPHRSPLLI